MCSDMYYGVKCSDGHTPGVLFKREWYETRLQPYADDLLLLCKCHNDLQLCLSRLHKYTIKWGLNINIKKSLFSVNIEEEIINFTSMGNNWSRLMNIHISVSYFIELVA